MLYLFIGNVCISPLLAMQIPIAIAITRIASIPSIQTLITAGTALTGAISSHFVTKSTQEKKTVAIQTHEQTPQNTFRASVPSTIVRPIIAQKIPTKVAQKTKATSAILPMAPTKVATLARTAQKTQVALPAEATAETLCENVAKNELKKLQLSALAKNAPKYTHITLPKIENPLLLQSIPQGARVSDRANTIYLSVQATNNIEEDNARFERTQAVQAVSDMQCKLHTNTRYKTEFIVQLRYVVKQLVKMQSGNIRGGIQTLLDLNNLAVEQPLNDTLQLCIKELKSAYIHYNGTPCHKAFMRPALAAKQIIAFVDRVEALSGKHISRYDIIDPSSYNELQACIEREKASINFARKIGNWIAELFVGPRVGSSCNQEGSYGPNWGEAAEEFNKDMETCMQACRDYDFTQAEAIAKRYNQSALLKDLIAQSKQEYASALERAYEEMYDEHGILRAVQEDPAYLVNKYAINEASPEEKKTINQNLLLRNHVKQYMHEQWHIPENAPHCVHEAMYTILGTDGSALADVHTLQRTIEDIIAHAGLSQHESLMAAFYEPNGVLKELALHLPEAKNIRIAKKILAPEYDEERKQLNDLVYEQIRSPEKAASAQEAIHLLTNAFAATNLQEAIEAKTAFEQSYTELITPEPLAPTVVQQNAEVPANQSTNSSGMADVKSSMPMPQGPEWEPEKNTKAITADIFNEKNIQHIFKDRPGHITDTPTNRKIITDITTDVKNYLGTDQYGNHWFAKILDNGQQAWAQTRNGIIRNCGLNAIPNTYNPVSGLSKLME